MKDVMTEFEKLVQTDIERENAEKDMEKVHEIALLERKGKRPVVINTPDENHVLFLEIDRSFNIHWENWNTGGKCDARRIDIKKTEDIR